MKKQSSIALVLGGGAARGFAHLGVLEFLESRHVEVKEVAGTSMGSLVGACFALGLSLNQIKNVLKEIKWLRLFQVNFSRVSLINGEKIERFFRDKLYGDKTFANCRIPLKVNATNVETGKEVIFSSGKIIDAVMASIAIPGIFPPKIIDNQILIDGGMVNNVPVDILDEKDLNRIFISNVRVPIDRPVLYRKYLEKKNNLWERSKMMFKPIFSDYVRKCFDILRVSHEDIRYKNIPPSHMLFLPYKNFNYEDFHKGQKIYKLGLETAEKGWGSIFIDKK